MQAKRARRVPHAADARQDHFDLDANDATAETNGAPLALSAALSPPSRPVSPSCPRARRVLRGSSEAKAAEVTPCDYRRDK